MSASYLDGADTVVLATGEAFPDGLAGGPLARLLAGPLLLTPTASLHDAAAAEITRLGARHVILLGGTAAISDDVETAVRVLGVTSQRLQGADRTETAVAVAEHMAEVVAARSLPLSDRVFLVNGENFPDATSASGPAARAAAPILLARASDLPDATDRYLDQQQAAVDEVVAVGGTAVLSEGVFQAARERATTTAISPVRLAGPERVATSVAAAEYDLLQQQVPLQRVILTNALEFPGALAAGPMAAAQAGAVMINVNGDNADRTVHMTVANFYRAWDSPVFETLTRIGTITDAVWQLHQDLA